MTTAREKLYEEMVAMSASPPGPGAEAEIRKLMTRYRVQTKPGIDDWRGMSNFGFRDESMNARNAFAPTLGDEQYRRFGLDLSGPLVKNRTSMAIAADVNSSYDSKTIVAASPGAMPRRLAW